MEIRKPRITCDFVDFWPGFSKYDNYFTKVLSNHFEIEIMPKPNFLIYSAFGRKHEEYDCIKIFYTGENQRPDFRECDFAFSFDYMNHPQHQRLPLYALYTNVKGLDRPKISSAEEPIRKERFCCMLVSNPNCAERNLFFTALSSYKKVDSAGHYLNNIGGPIPLDMDAGRTCCNKNKLDFISQYKFVLAFENSSHAGYTTEKIVEPFLANSIPIYWGNPLVHLEFNEASFVNCHQFRAIAEVVERIRYIDNNDDVYRQMIAAPKLSPNACGEPSYEEKVLEHFQRIFAASKPLSFRGLIYPRLARSRSRLGIIKRKLLGSRS